MLFQLRQLWQEAFGDSDETIKDFFATGFSPDRYHYICDGDTPVSALYWFDCQLAGQKIAYIYALATLKSHRGQGLAHRLLSETHKLLKKKGYAGAVLVPAEGLFPFYEEIGYRAATRIDRFICQAGGEPVALREIDTEEYARLRRTYLPAGGVIQEGPALDWLHTYAKFYAGADFLLTAATEGDTLLAQEFWGNTDSARGILTTLGMAEGRFRIPGTGRDFAMYLPLTEDCPTPSYFGLALD